MSESRASILANIRRALTAARLPEPPTTPLPSPTLGQPPSELIERFASELEALTGTFHAVPRAGLTNFIVQALRERNSPDIATWRADQLPAPEVVIGLRTAGVGVREGDLPHDGQRAEALTDLARVTVGLTGADAALADTGTLALIGGPGRPRLASMSVRTHIALFTPEQLYPSMAAWLAGRKEVVQRLRSASALTFISGPSRTADIEMTLTVGVHGPAEVVAVLVN
jgi:L-lactate dehydrogenase complex protein LldG